MAHTVVATGQSGPDNWREGLCGCFNDLGTCCTGLFCACYLYGQNVSATTGDGCCGPCFKHFLCGGFPCIVSDARTNIRLAYNLPAQVRRAVI